MTVELAAERGVSVDRAGFDAAMEEQRARSKAARVRVGFEGGPQLPGTLFVGYDVLEAPRHGAADRWRRAPRPAPGGRTRTG